jgi:hypothetical protein
MFGKKRPMREPDPEPQLPASIHEPDSLSSDLPLSNVAGDEFGRAGFADRIADAVATRTAASTLVIGVYGPWGSGKTTVLEFVRRRLEEIDKDRLPAVWFNPWRYGSEELLVQGLFETLADVLKLSLPTVRDKIGGWLQKAGRATGALTISSFDAQAAVGGGLAAAGQALSQRTLERDRAQLNAALRKSGKRIVVMIDDIDRLDSNEIVTILRAVKLAADFDNLVYILAFDRARVAEALCERYPDAGGADFLHKMVQLPLNLPRVDPMIVGQRLLRDVGQLLARHNAELSDQDLWRLGSALDQAVLPRVRTARDHTLYLNTIEFAVPAHRGELNLVDVVLLEALRLFFPDGYEMVSARKRAVLSINDSDTVGMAALKGALETLDIDEGDRPSLNALLLALFPQFGPVFSNTHHSDWEVAEWIGGRRICTERYFDRFFSYGLPPGDVADTAIDGVVTDRDTARALSELIGRSDQTIVLAKLLDRVPTVPQQHVRQLIDAVSAIAGDLPALRNYSDLAAPRWHASVLVVRLSARLPETDRRPAALHVLSHADVEFATLVLRWLRTASAPGVDDALLTDDDISVVAAALADRLLDLDQDVPLIDRSTALVHEMYGLVFRSDPARAARQLAAALADPKRLARLLRASVVPTIGATDQAPVSTMLDNEALGRLVTIVPARILRDAATASAVDTVDDMDRTLIRRFTSFMQRADSAGQALRPLPMIQHEPTLNPLSNRSPIGAIGGGDPHNADLAIRVGVLLPVAAGTPLPHDPPASRLLGQNRENALVKLFDAAPITKWLEANGQAFNATGVDRWTVTDARGNEYTSLTADLVGSDGFHPVRARAYVYTGHGQIRQTPSLLIELDLSFALLQCDERRAPTKTRHESTPPPAPAALSVEELVDALEAMLGLLETARKARPMLITPGTDHAAISVWITSRNGLDRVIKISHLSAVGNNSVGEVPFHTYMQLGPAPVGQPATEPITARDFAIVCVGRILAALNRRGFEIELDLLRNLDE